MLTLMTRSGRGFYDWKNDKLQTYRSRLSNRLKNHGYTLGEKRDIDRQRRDEDHPYYSTQIRAVVAECLLCSPSERPSAERLLEKTQEGLNAMLRAKGIDPIVAGLKYPPYHQALLDDKFYVSDIQYINAQAGAAGGTAQVQQAEQERLAREQDARKQAAPEAAAQAARERAAREARDRAAAEARVRAEQADRERQRERERTIREQAERDQERGRVPVDRGAGRAPRHGGRARKQAGQERADRELAQQLADFGIDSVEGQSLRSLPPRRPRAPARQVPKELPTITFMVSRHNRLGPPGDKILTFHKIPGLVGSTKVRDAKELLENIYDVGLRANEMKFLLDTPLPDGNDRMEDYQQLSEFPTLLQEPYVGVFEI